MFFSVSTNTASNVACMVRDVHLPSSSVVSLTGTHITGLAATFHFSYMCSDNNSSTIIPLCNCWKVPPYMPAYNHQSTRSIPDDIKCVSSDLRIEELWLKNMDKD